MQHRSRFGLALVLSSLALAAAVPAYLFLAPDSKWEPESLLIVLVILAFVSYSAAASVRDMVTLDAGFIVALIALVFLGPAPAACVFALPEISAWIERRRIVSLVSDTAAALWGALAAALTLQLLTSGVPLHPGWEDLPAIAVAGAVLLIVAYLVTQLFTSVVWEGLNLRSLIQQEVIQLAPASVVLLAIGTVTTLLYEELGPVGLAPLALVVLLPRALVPRLSESRDPAKLDRTAAISLYARAIAEGLELDTAQKRVLLDAATHLGDAKRLTRIEDFDRVMQTVLYCGERWDGKGGFPGVLSGDEIPMESRVLAVAEQLGSMTASGTRGISTAQAIAALVARAGTEFDPEVVFAARWAIEKNVLVVSPEPAMRAARRTSRPVGRIRSTQSR